MTRQKKLVDLVRLWAEASSAPNQVIACSKPDLRRLAGFLKSIGVPECEFSAWQELNKGRPGAKNTYTWKVPHAAVTAGRGAPALVRGMESVQRAAGGEAIGNTLTIATLNTPVRNYLVPAMQFASAKTGVRYQVLPESLDRYVEPRAALEQHLADYAVISWAGPATASTELTHHPLYTWDIRVVAPHEFGDVKTVSISEVAERAKTSALYLSPRPRGNRELIDRACSMAQVEFRLASIVSTPDTGVRVALAAAGLGITLAPSDALSAEQREQFPRLVGADNKRLHGVSTLSWLTSAKPPGHDAFIEMVAKAVEESYSDLV